MNYKEIIKNLLMLALPYIKKLIESQVVPFLIRRSYEIFDNKANHMIEKLAALMEKIKNTNDIEKQKHHIEGFKLGIATIKVIGQKLVDASVTLEKEVC
jgi:hypothetical protein